MANSTPEQERDLNQARLVSVLVPLLYCISRKEPYTRRKTAPTSLSTINPTKRQKT